MFEWWLYKVFTTSYTNSTIFKLDFFLFKNCHCVLDNTKRVEAYFFTIKELISLRTFVLILVVFVVFLNMFRPNFTSGRLQVINRNPFYSCGYKTQHSYPRSRLITWRIPDVKFGRNVVRKTIKITNIRAKVRNKINTQIKKPHLNKDSQ